MRAEANRGASVIATIHQPSANIFMMFDRIIILSEGYMVFNGPPETAYRHF
jgi:ABC-type multidrug transport system ATPase subunit